MACSTLHLVAYLCYGCYVYYWQGQYAFTISYLGLSVYRFWVVCNMMALVSRLMAAGLYGNIGITMLYNNVLMELFNAPPITTKKDRVLFGMIVPVYWSLAFVAAAAIKINLALCLSSQHSVSFSSATPSHPYYISHIQRRRTRCSRVKGSMLTPALRNGKIAVSRGWSEVSWLGDGTSTFGTSSMLVVHWRWLGLEHTLPLLA